MRRNERNQNQQSNAYYKGGRPLLAYPTRAGDGLLGQAPSTRMAPGSYPGSAVPTRGPEPYPLPRAGPEPLFDPRGVPELYPGPRGPELYPLSRGGPEPYPAQRSAEQRGGPEIYPGPSGGPEPLNREKEPYQDRMVPRTKGFRATECPICVRKVPELLRHANARHFPWFLYAPAACMACLMQFNHKKDLAEHMLKDHGGQNTKMEPQLWVACIKEFMEKLAKHLNIHVDDMPSFVVKNNLGIASKGPYGAAEMPYYDDPSFGTRHPFNPNLPVSLRDCSHWRIILRLMALAKNVGTDLVRSAKPTDGYIFFLDDDVQMPGSAAQHHTNKDDISRIPPQRSSSNGALQKHVESRLDRLDGRHDTASDRYIAHDRKTTSDIPGRHEVPHNPVNDHSLAKDLMRAVDRGEVQLSLLPHDIAEMVAGLIQTEKRKAVAPVDDRRDEKSNKRSYEAEIKQGSRDRYPLPNRSPPVFDARKGYTDEELYMAKRRRYEDDKSLGERDQRTIEEVSGKELPFGYDETLKRTKRITSSPKMPSTSIGDRYSPKEYTRPMESGYRKEERKTHLDDRSSRDMDKYAAYRFAPEDKTSDRYDTSRSVFSASMGYEKQISDYPKDSSYKWADFDEKHFRTNYRDEREKPRFGSKTRTEAATRSRDPWSSSTAVPTSAKTDIDSRRDSRYDYKYSSGASIDAPSQNLTDISHLYPKYGQSTAQPSSTKASNMEIDNRDMTDYEHSRSRSHTTSNELLKKATTDRSNTGDEKLPADLAAKLKTLSEGMSVLTDAVMHLSKLKK